MPQVLKKTTRKPAKNMDFPGTFIKIRKTLYAGDQKAKEFFLFSLA